jgi:hypothetical protein
MTWVMTPVWVNTATTFPGWRAAILRTARTQRARSAARPAEVVVVLARVARPVVGEGGAHLVDGPAVGLAAADLAQIGVDDERDARRAPEVAGGVAGPQERADPHRGERRAAAELLGGEASRTPSSLSGTSVQPLRRIAVPPPLARVWPWRTRTRRQGVTGSLAKVRRDTCRPACPSAT